LGAAGTGGDASSPLGCELLDASSPPKKKEVYTKNTGKAPVAANYFNTSNTNPAKHTKITSRIKIHP
jgi:hypothetical protein